jgi:hypothetical protein
LQVWTQIVCVLGFRRIWKQKKHCMEYNRKTRFYVPSF